MSDTHSAPRLTSLSHGGGCGCKISPGVLATLLQQSAPAQAFAGLLVGTETADDAAVYQLNDEQAISSATPIHLVSPRERRESAKVKAFAEHVTRAMP